MEYATKLKVVGSNPTHRHTCDYGIYFPCPYVPSLTKRSNWKLLYNQLDIMKYFVTSSEYILHIDIFIFSAKLIDWLRFILVSHLIIYVI